MYGCSAVSSEDFPQAVSRYPTTTQSVEHFSVFNGLEFSSRAIELVGSEPWLVVSLFAGFQTLESVLVVVVVLSISTSRLDLGTPHPSDVLEHNCQ